MSNILVTGGAGFIGSHTAKLLSRSGFLPICVDDLSRGNEWAVKWGPFERVDITDSESLVRVLRKYNPSAVLHFAALAYVGESISDPYRYYRNNVQGTISLLEAMRDVGCNQFVFSSTCATYGVPKKSSIAETDPQEPVNPYGASKLMVERILSDASDAYGLRFIALRYFNASGSDPECEVGEAHRPETHLIPLALLAASGSGPSLSVFGNDYETDDGTCVRDYVHVSDLASAHVLALHSLLSGGDSGFFNLGNERGYSVLEIIKSVEIVTGLKVPYYFSARRHGDPPYLVARAHLAREKLGWNPQYASLQTQISHAWEWMRRCSRS